MMCWCRTLDVYAGCCSLCLLCCVAMRDGKWKCNAAIWKGQHELNRSENSLLLSFVLFSTFTVSVESSDSHKQRAQYQDTHSENSDGKSFRSEKESGKRVTLMFMTFSHEGWKCFGKSFTESESTFETAIWCNFPVRRCSARLACVKQRRNDTSNNCLQFMQSRVSSLFHWWCLHFRTRTQQDIELLISFVFDCSASIENDCKSQKQHANKQPTRAHKKTQPSTFDQR